MATILSILKSKREIPSLVNICINIMQVNINDVGSLAYLPDEYVIKILSVCTAEQLEEKERINEEEGIELPTDSLWKILCEKDLGCREKDKENSNWKEVYKRKKEERTNKFDLISSRLQKEKRKKDMKSSSKQVQQISEPKEQTIVYERKIQKQNGTSKKTNEIQKKVIKTVVRRETTKPKNSSSASSNLKKNPVLKMLDKKFRIPEEKKPKETRKVQSVQQVQRAPSRPLIHIPAPQKKINLQRSSSPTNIKVAPPVKRNVEKPLFFEKPKVTPAMKKIVNKVERTQISDQQIQKERILILMQV
eukprot:gene7-4258_t